MRVLYLTNIHNPYRDKFFEQLGKKCDLTVLFERRLDLSRDSSWFDVDGTHSYREVFLPDNEGIYVSKTMLSTILEGWDLIIVGCYNEPKEATAILWMRLRRIPYAVNLDGPLFNKTNPFKQILRRMVLRGASIYYVAGRKSVASVRAEVGKGANIVPYLFSSLDKQGVKNLRCGSTPRESNVILCAGKYEEYKGLDILLETASHLPRYRFKIVGMGRREAAFKQLVKRMGLDNIETDAFMSSEQLYAEMKSATLFVLPSRQECWGLVINEAAACGCPIVSTWGSGAAVEFLSDRYPHQLAESGSKDSLLRAIDDALHMNPMDIDNYSSYLQEMSESYTIESMVYSHMSTFESICLSQKVEEGK